ncbi:CRIB domain-containing protein RIC1-like [Diospyros lotus]|uniref:CRIB domain-containing protein RIC1-like n=1 Tax=Diospyros lotus TaxID=55363 RepID=UPI002251CA31|nr:CRIB domain-containing protein RIC1-like [Diospyros lotus]
MSTKVKGLFKGLRYISQIFDEQKEPEMQIGHPTDVKHVSHVGCDRPSVDSPSWMTGFKPPHEQGAQPASSSSANGNRCENPETKGVSQDSNSTRKCPRSHSRPAKEYSEVPESSARHHSHADDSSTAECSTREPSDKPKQHRKNPNRKPKNPTLKSADCSSQDPSNVPKKSQRKKPKELSGEGPKRPSKPGANASTCT